MNISLHRTISEYLNNPVVRETLGVDSTFTSNFTLCSHEVEQAFGANLDLFFPTKYQIAGLLDRDIRVLIYVGANDWACNWVCNFFNALHPVLDPLINVSHDVVDCQ